MFFSIVRLFLFWASYIKSNRKEFVIFVLCVNFCLTLASKPSFTCWAPFISYAILLSFDFVLKLSWVLFCSECTSVTGVKWCKIFQFHKNFVEYELSQQVLQYDFFREQILQTTLWIQIVNAQVILAAFYCHASSDTGNCYILYSISLFRLSLICLDVRSIDIMLSKSN